jgi:hypothetical protein
MANKMTNDELKAQLAEMETRLQQAEAKAAEEAEARVQAEAKAAELQELLHQPTTETSASVESAPQHEEIFVDVYVPKAAAGDEPNHFVGVNGDNYLLPKGKTSRVPKRIADEYYRGVKAQEILEKRKEELLNA